MRKNLLFLTVWFVLSSCTQEGAESNRLFRLVDGKESGIDFENKLEYQKGFDVFRYRNYYNGGGVGIGDLNNDGLSDVFLVSNLFENKLFLNKGGLKFEDMTQKAGVGGSKPWSTGVAIADVNGDGWLDIYVCNSGDIEGGNRENDLFINNQDGTFSERAGDFGLNDRGFSTHAAFFDFDQDGDLDCYLLNNSFRPVSSLPLENIRTERDSTGGDKLYRNDDGFFKDISQEAGVYGSVIGFGLGITLLDVNGDHWTDIYVSNDFFERDYLYVNQKDGTFSEQLESYFDQTSLFSMGADAGDLNNDGYPEVFVTDMLPDNNYRLKTTTRFENFDLYQLKLERGFYHQFMKNTLQLNNGDSTFSDIGYFSNVSSTDWSWGALILDLDNNLLKDLFVANGVYKDVTDQDFITYFSSEENIKAALSGNEVDFEKFNERMPSNPVRNYAFMQTSKLVFEDVADSIGFGQKTFSNGAAYGDLDNDGDLDLVLNNLNMPAFLYENRTNEKTENHFLKMSLVGESKNGFAVGTVLKCYLGEDVVFYEHYPTRGFQSSMDYNVTLGMGSATKVDSLEVFWPDGTRSMMHDVPVDTFLTLSQADGKEITSPVAPKSVFLKEFPLQITHKENQFIDYDRERLIYRTLSKEGPALACGDINSDGVDDFFIGGAVGYPGLLLLSENDPGSYSEMTPAEFLDDRASEDVDAAFFDADGDGDLDLYVVSGGNEYPESSRNYVDRLYLLEKKGRSVEVKRSNKLPAIPESGSCVRPCDYDGDGDLDLFVGSRSIPGRYGLPATSILLENVGGGVFEDVTRKRITQLGRLGMVTDAAWADVDGDDDFDLVVVGEWMPIIIFKNHKSFFQRAFDINGLEDSKGWWNAVKSYDINGDGLQDFIFGNWGLNSRFKASKEKPVVVYISDFDENGTLDHIYGHYEGDKLYPYALRDDISKQLVSIKKKYTSYSEFAEQTIEDMFTQEQLANAIRQEAFVLSSQMAINKGNDTFEMVELPKEAQFSPVFSITIDNVDGMEGDELILLGNFSYLKPEEGRYAANHGLVYRIHADGSLEFVPGTRSGLVIRGDIRKAVAANIWNGQKLLMIGRNDDTLKAYEY